MFPKEGFVEMTQKQQFWFTKKQNNNNSVNSAWNNLLFSQCEEQKTTWKTETNNLLWNERFYELQRFFMEPDFNKKLLL